MENNQNKQKTSLKDFWKNYGFTIICFLSSLPLIALGAWGILYFYRGQTVWQSNNMYWIKPLALTLLICIVEFVIVVLPIIMIKTLNHEKDNSNYYKFYKQNLKKELRFNITSLRITLKKTTKQEHNKETNQQIVEIKKQIKETKLLYWHKLGELNKQNKLNQKNKAR